MKKLSVITIILLILCGCAGNGNIEDTTLPVEADDMSEVTDEVTPGFVVDLNVELHSLASDYILSDADSYKIYLGEYLFAYITTDNKVFYVTDHGGGAVDSGYIPGAVNANAVFGNGWLVFVLDDTGTVSAFNVLDGEHIELSGEMIGPFYDELSKCNGHVEDMYYTSSDCWAIRSDSKWVCSDTLDWVDWSRVVEIAGNGTGSAPAMALYSDGRVYLNTDGSSYDEILYSKTESWTDVSHIADGLAPFGLTGDGRLLTVSNAYYLASDYPNFRTGLYYRGIKKRRNRTG